MNQVYNKQRTNKAGKEKKGLVHHYFSIMFPSTLFRNDEKTFLK